MFLPGLDFSFHGPGYSTEVSFAVVSDDPSPSLGRFGFPGVVRAGFFSAPDVRRLRRPSLSTKSVRVEYLY